MEWWVADIDRFATPEAFLLLVLLLPVALWAGLRRPASLRFSSAIPFRSIAPSFRQRFRPVLVLLRAVALALLVTALARPQHGFGETRVTAEGVAIMTVVDRSWSMTEKMHFDGRSMSRIDVVKDVFREFVQGNGEDLPGRPYDMIGLVSFAKYADTVCPLVRAHDVLVDLVDSVTLVDPRRNHQEAGTAIGEGLALAAARLDKAERLLQERIESEETDGDFTIKSKVIILLTDGEENSGIFRWRDAAGLCEKLGIKVYAIGIGGSDDRGSGRGFFRQRGFGFSERTIREIADITGGKHWVVESGDDLREVYAEIDELEKTEIESIEHTSYAERFMPWAITGAALLLLETLLGATLLRRSP